MQSILDVARALLRADVVVASSASADSLDG